jgi:hypothetical protein
MLLLACTAQAGYIQNDTPAPAPTPTASTAETPTESPSPDTSNEPTDANGYIQNDASGALAEAALFVLNGVLALF